MAEFWRVGVWCAVSSKPQADPEKESLPSQEQAGRDFARAVGGEVVAVYVVPGHSRDYWSWHEAEQEMPAYRQVREDLQAGKLDVVHCLDSDRLGRDPALIQQFYSLAERCACEVYDASMPHQLGQQSIGHRYGTAVKSVAAGEDQRRRVHRHRSGMRGRVRRGLHPAVWPVGYQAIRDEGGRCLGAEFDDLIGAVQLITRLFLEGRGYHSIVDELNKSAWTLPGGRLWYYSAVRRALQNDIYAGFVSWGSVRSSEPSPHFPALWDGATYAAVLRERERRKESYTHPRGGPLTGVAFCARCGWSMNRVRPRPNSGYYLRCSKHAGTRDANWAPCHPNHLLESAALGALLAWVRDLASPEVLDRALRAERGLPDLDQEAAFARSRLEELEGNRQRLALALAAGHLDAGMYRATDDGILAELERVRARLAEVDARIRAQPDPEEMRAHLDALLEGLPHLLREGDPGAVSGAFRTVGVRVWCEDRAVVLITLM